MKTTTRISDRYYRQYRQTTDEDIYNKDRYQRQLDKTTDEEIYNKTDIIEQLDKTTDEDIYNKTDIRGSQTKLQMKTSITRQILETVRQNYI